MSRIKTVLIGAGYRGRYLLGLMRSVAAFDVVAVADVKADVSLPEGVTLYSDGPDDYQRMIISESPELVVVASPWYCHVMHATFAVSHGAHVALEIKGGLRLGEYQSLLSVAARRSCLIFPLENTLFMRQTMAIKRLVDEGTLGEIVAMRGGYRHDLRHIIVDKDGRLGNLQHPEGDWRSRFYVEANADIYPTHGFAPLCMAAGLHHFSDIMELTAFASKAKGISDYLLRQGISASPRITMGDIIITQMQTVHGQMVTLTHDTTLPRPRSLDLEIQGTRGIWSGEKRSIYIENLSPHEQWESDGTYLSRHEHPYWRLWGNEALRIDAHHEGMDYIMVRMMADHLLGEAVYPADGEDLALWTSVTPLSALSIAERRTVYPRHEHES